mgnify:CR=1 FL=1
MDFAKLVGDKGPVDESLEAAEVTFDDFKNGGDDALKLTLHPFNGTRFKNSLRIARKRFEYDSKADEADEADEDVKDVSEKTDAEIWTEIEIEDERGNELMARMTDDWNLTDGGKPVPYTFENGKAFYAAARGVFGAVEAKVVDMGNDLKKQKKDSD